MSENVKSKESDSDSQIVKEFGGPIGSFLIILWSHSWMLYLWLAIEYYQGGVFIPKDLGLLKSQLAKAIPTLQTIAVYWGFMSLQIILAMTLPGPVIKGLPVPSENNKQYNYLCNAISCWYFTLFLVAVLHFTGIFKLTFIIDNLGSLMVTAIISGDLVSLIIYFWGILIGKQIRMSGNFIYDFFMGSWMNPRIGKLDLKMFAEIRGSWIQLFLLTLSCAVKQYEDLGYITNSMKIILVAHFLYSNACMKGEECVPTTWDIFYEKFGWMLIFWNIAGVPYVYCFHSFYLLKNSNINHSPLVTAVMFIVLLFAYYIWDTAQSQKNRFRMQLRGTFIKRWTFPQLPWGTIENPKYLKTESGSCLLIDGWWKYARKIHYTADIVMASIWALSCGFTGLLPFFYPVFFIFMILHRYFRDYERCERKYKNDWEKYCKAVPYTFIPYLL